MGFRFVQKILNLTYCKIVFWIDFNVVTKRINVTNAGISTLIFFYFTVLFSFLYSKLKWIKGVRSVRVLMKLNFSLLQARATNTPTMHYAFDFTWMKFCQEIINSQYSILFTLEKRTHYITLIFLSDSIKPVILKLPPRLPSPVHHQWIC